MTRSRAHSTVTISVVVVVLVLCLARGWVINNRASTIYYSLCKTVTEWSVITVCHGHGHLTHTHTIGE